MKTKELIEDVEKGNICCKGCYKIGYKVGAKSKEEEIKKELKVARQCLHFKNCYCDNQDCKNKYCPLNKEFENE